MNLHLMDWLFANLAWIDLPGYLGGVCVVIAFLMQRMIPLRIMTIIGNVLFIVYYDMTARYPSLLINAVLLPLNAWRLYQMLHLARRVRSASEGEETLGVLRPFMQRRRFKAGQSVFRKNDPAKRLLYLVSGEFRVPELGVVLRQGDYVGELGLVAPDGQRTQSLDCVRDGEVLQISYEHVNQLYYQNRISDRTSSG